MGKQPFNIDVLPPAPETFNFPSWKFELEDGTFYIGANKDLELTVYKDNPDGFGFKAVCNKDLIDALKQEMCRNGFTNTFENDGFNSEPITILTTEDDLKVVITNPFNIGISILILKGGCGEPHHFNLTDYKDMRAKRKSFMKKFI